MVLWLLRHGKAADAVAFRGSDRERPLTERGEAQAEEAGRMLAEYVAAPDAILTSTRVRAQQTAELAAEGHGSAPEPIAFEQLGGDYDLDDLLALLSPWDEPGQHVWVVGHNPTLSMLLYELTGEDRGLSTGAFAGIDLADRSLVHRGRPSA